MKTDLNYCIVLSSEQLGYLAGSKYGIDRMKILHQAHRSRSVERNGVCDEGIFYNLTSGASHSFGSGFVLQIGL